MCSYCGQEQIVKRNPGVVYLEPLSEQLGDLATATIQIRNEMVRKRLTEEIADLEIQHDYDFIYHILSIGVFF
jgi:hypothetical protein